MRDFDSEAYMRQMAGELGLTLDDAEFARVKMVFGNLQRLAGQLREAKLTDDTIAAAVFRPPV